MFRAPRNTERGMSKSSQRELIDRQSIHYRYEVEMLRDTHERLISGKFGPDTDRVVRNALIESFCIHARGLIEFFTSKPGGAEKFTKDFDYLDVRKGGVVKMRKSRLNIQVAHLLFDNRAVNAAGKINDGERFELLRIIAPKTVEFQRRLKSEFSGISVPTIDMAGMVEPPPGSGGTTTSSSATVYTFESPTLSSNHWKMI
jgi:hypothetical protein